MPALNRPPIPVVVQQYLDGAIAQRERRAVLVRAPHVQLHRLRRLDDQLIANLDGLATAGDGVRPLYLAALEDPGRGAAFVNAVAAIEARDPALLERLLAVAEAVSEARAGLVSAFGWVDAGSLRGITRALLDSPDPFRRGIGLLACAMHHADPQGVLDAAVADADTRRQALSIGGRLGRTDLLPACLQDLAHEDAVQRFEAARAALLLGDRGGAVRALAAFALSEGPCRFAALALVLKVLPPVQADALLQPLAQQPSSARLLIRALGAAGDPRHVPWLIDRMGEPAHARLAGESFCTITGVDLAAADLESEVPLDAGAGPDDASEDVVLDEDESLPWPDPDKVADWWQHHASRFSSGVAYFMGAPPSRAHGLAVLNAGGQRQRIAAAEWLCLLQPGTPLFNTAAPAWRQQRWLAQMGA